MRSITPVSAKVLNGSLAIAISSLMLCVSEVPGWTQTAPNRIAIEYLPPKSPQFQQLYNLVRERKALEKFQEIFSPFLLANDLPLKMTECGMSNAWYQRPSLTICYEYLEDIQKTMPQGDTPAGLTRADVVIGQLFYVVAHEMGHAMFDQLNVPLFGRAEDAADGFRGLHDVEAR